MDLGKQFSPTKNCDGRRNCREQVNGIDKPVIPNDRAEDLLVRDSETVQVGLGTEHGRRRRQILRSEFIHGEACVNVRGQVRCGDRPAEREQQGDILPLGSRANLPEFVLDHLSIFLPRPILFIAMTLKQRHRNFVAQSATQEDEERDRRQSKD